MAAISPTCEPIIKACTSTTAATRANTRGRSSRGITSTRAATCATGMLRLRHPGCGMQRRADSSATTIRSRSRPRPPTSRPCTWAALCTGNKAWIRAVSCSRQSGADCASERLLGGCGYPRGFYSLGVNHRAVELDDDGIDIVEAIVDLHGLLGAQHECGLGQAVGSSRERSDDRGAANLARGMARARIDDVVVAHAVFLEEPFVVARGRDRRVDQGNARDHFPFALARVADPHHPGLAESIPDNAAVAAGADIHPRIAARFQYVDASIHRITLGDAAKIDAHPLLGKLHRLILRVEQHMAIVDRRQGLVDLRLVRVDVLGEVVHVADAGI